MPIRQQLARLWKANSAFALAAGSGVISPAVGLLTAPILTRLFTPAEFGVLGSFAAVLAAALSVVNLRYEVTVPLPKEEAEAYSLARAAMKIGLIASGVLTLVFILIAPWIFKPEMVAGMRPYFWWLPCALALASATQVLTQFAIRRGAFGELAGARLVQGITGPTVQIGTGLAGFGVVGLLLGQMASQCGGLLRLWRSFRAVGKTLTTVPAARPLLKRYEHFPRVSSLPAFINALGLQLPLLIVAYAHGAAAAGLILLINRIFGTPISIMSSAAGQTLVSEGAKLRREGLDTAPALRRMIRRQLFLVGPILLVVPFLPWLFPRVFGAEWVEAGRYALALVPAIVMQGIFGPAGVILDVNERQDLHFIREVVRVAVIVGAVFAAKFFGGTLWAIVILLSIALAVSSVFGFWLVTRSAKR